MPAYTPRLIVVCSGAGTFFEVADLHVPSVSLCVFEFADLHGPL